MRACGPLTWSISRAVEKWAIPSERRLPPGPLPGVRRFPHHWWALSWAVTRKTASVLTSLFVRKPIPAEEGVGPPLVEVVRVDAGLVPVLAVLDPDLLHVPHHRREGRAEAGQHHARGDDEFHAAAAVLADPLREDPLELKADARAAARG